MNKGKRSFAVNLREAEGRELVAALITAPGPEAGIFLTNLQVGDWLSYETLCARRADLIMLRIIGNPDGTVAVDYTVNAAHGLAVRDRPGGPGTSRSTTCCRAGT